MKILIGMAEFGRGPRTVKYYEEAIPHANFGKKPRRLFPVLVFGVLDRVCLGPDNTSIL